MTVNPKLINAAADVIQASMDRGNREAYSLAVDLDSAGLLRAPEAAEELEAVRLTHLQEAANWVMSRGHTILAREMDEWIEGGAR